MKFWFTLLMSLLIIANFSAIYYLDNHTDRWFRFASTLIVLFIYISKYLQSKRLLWIVILFTLCDFFLIYYEIPFLKNSVYVSRILAYLLLIQVIVPSLSKLKLNLITLSIAVFTIVIDLYLINEMAESLPASDQNFIFLVLFYLLGIISLVLGATCLSYLNRYSDKKAFFLVVVSFGFILSDIFYYNAYYLGFQEFFYLDRLTNITGLGALVLYSREKIKSISEIEVA